MLRRWVTSSVVKILKDDSNIDLVFGLFQQNTPETEESLPDGVLKRIEFRVSGPISRTTGQNRTMHSFDLNFLITQSRTNDVYVLDEELDALRKAVSRNFCIFRIDDSNAVEPFELIGTLRIDMSTRRPLYVHNFGLLKPQNNLAQGVVQGRFSMTLSEDFT